MPASKVLGSDSRRVEAKRRDKTRTCITHDSWYMDAKYLITDITVAIDTFWMLLFWFAICMLVGQ